MAAEQRTIPVHALGDERVHLALPQHGRLRQGRLKTLCGKQAVSELPLFASIEAKARCRICFGEVDEHGYLRTGERISETSPGKATPPGRLTAPAPRKKKATSPAKRSDLTDNKPMSGRYGGKPPPRFISSNRTK